MSPRDNRAASEVVGAVIIFSFLVVSFAVYQGVVVPAQNERVEFEHNQAAQRSMQELRNAVRGTAATGAGASVSIQLGADYPPRTLGLNLGGSAGTLRTDALRGLAVENVTATEPEVRDHVGATTTTLGPFETAALAYRPVYSHYAGAPVTRYENTLAYNGFPGGPNLSITGQAVVDGRTISLVVLDGSVEQSAQGTVTVDTTAVSVARRTVAVTDAGGPITLVLPTRLTAANWTTLLADELDAGSDDDRHVTAVRPAGPDAVAIELEPGVTYELRLAKVGVGATSAEEGPAYVTTVEGDRQSVVEGGTARLVVETRDRFNNPQSNVTVSAAVTAGPGSIAGAPSAATGVDGRATFVYAAPPQVSGTRDVAVEVTFGGGTPANRTATFDLSVLDVDGGVNPAGAGAVVIEDETIGDDGCGTPPVDCAVTVTFDNTDDEAVTVTSARYAFYAVGADPGPERDAPESLDFEGTSLALRGPSAATDVTLPPGATDVRLRFYEDADGTTPFEVRQGDFFIVTLQFDDGDSATYFVAPA